MKRPVQEEEMDRVAYNAGSSSWGKEVSEEEDGGNSILLIYPEWFQLAENNPFLMIIEQKQNKQRACKRGI